MVELLRASWGSTRMASRGRLIEVTELPGFVAQAGDRWLGYAAYHIIGNELEIAVLESPAPGRGAGSALVARCVQVARDDGLRSVWLITTNDNLHALRFYQRRGFVLVALHRDAVTDARDRLKPEIGLTGLDGIPIRDELELELPIAEWPAFVERYGWPSS